MQTGETILSSSVLNEKFLQALLMLLALKGMTKGFIIGSILSICLFLYSMLIDALWEITSHIGTLWMQADPVTRLLMLCLAVYVVRKLSPLAILLYKKGL